MGDDGYRLHILEALEVPYDKDASPRARSACGYTRGYGGESLNKYSAGTDFLVYPFYLAPEIKDRICKDCMFLTIEAFKHHKELSR